MNIPYLNNTTIGIEVSDRTLRWVEASKIGNSISIKSSGSFTHNNSDIGLRDSIEEVKSHLSADVFKIAVSNTNFLLHSSSEEIPFFDEEDRKNTWVKNREKEILIDYGKHVSIKSHIFNIDEDFSRCLFQVVDTKSIYRLEQILLEAGLYLNYVFTGCFEAAYTQIKNKDFVEDLSFVILPEDNRSYLSCFSSGLICNFFVLEVGLNDGVERIIKETQSFAQTEKMNLNKEESLHSIWVPEYAKKDFLAQGTESNVVFFKPEYLKKEQLNAEQITSLGISIKSFYDGLDSFNFISHDQQEKSLIQFEKKGAVKASILLAVPLILIMLILYSVSSYLEYQLRETNQITEKISDNLELVVEKREQLMSTYQDYSQVKKLIEQRINSARIFGEINKVVSSNSWLTSIEVQKEGSGYEIVIEGEANQANAVTELMRKLELSDVISDVRLISSGNIENGARAQNNQSVGILSFELRAFFES
ncbi:hypothetical protein A8B79_05880 [Balneola sp. EhC07]|uniref:PilN domain-containing protein n=1 Tax=Balneola sp. EhC07 TaxID=1849360 RepID=UPI0007F40E87|nr:PilN domain-containing protein [Balneola sp. EhC07]OAN61004.1 hypothetical protein A8B79_05880 [Balneola sp. EhC07]